MRLSTPTTPLRLAAWGPFRFWINDDADDGDIAEGDDDLPGQSSGSANYGDDVVNGRGDLLDFFAVWLDIKPILDLVPPGDDSEYKLRHDDGALRFVYTDLSKGQAGQYLTSRSHDLWSQFQ